MIQIGAAGKNLDQAKWTVKYYEDCLILARKKLKEAEERFKRANDEYNARRRRSK